MPRRRTPGPRGHTDPVYIRVRSCLEIYGLKCSGLCLAADGIVYNKTPEELSPVIMKQLPQIYQGILQTDRDLHVSEIIKKLKKYGVLALPPKNERTQNAEFLEEMTSIGPAWEMYCRLWWHYKIATNPKIPWARELKNLMEQTRVRNNKLINLPHITMIMNNQDVSIRFMFPFYCVKTYKPSSKHQNAGQKIALAAGLTKEEFRKKVEITMFKKDMKFFRPREEDDIIYVWAWEPISHEELLWYLGEGPAAYYKSFKDRWPT